jgi:phospholipid N-methyltransferase
MSLSFFKAFIKKPTTIGAFAPSSKALAKEMLKHWPEKSGDLIVEYGPGTGAFSKVLHNKLDGQTSIALEIMEDFIPELQAKYQGTEFIHSSADELGKALEQRELHKPKLIISGLPWAIFPDELQDSILRETYLNLADDGYFSTFAYYHALKMPNAKKFYDKIQNTFSRVEKSNITWKNFPPAIVYHCRK